MMQMMSTATTTRTSPSPFQTVLDSSFIMASCPKKNTLILLPMNCPRKGLRFPEKNSESKPCAGKWNILGAMDGLPISL